MPSLTNGFSREKTWFDQIKNVVCLPQDNIPYTACRFFLLPFEVGFSFDFILVRPVYNLRVDGWLVDLAVIIEIKIN